MSHPPSELSDTQLPGHSVRRLIAHASIRCPFTAHINPHRDAGAVAANAWYLETFGNSKFAQRIFAAHMEQLTAGFYPQASLAQLTLANKILLWAFSVDDMVDETDTGRDSRQLASLFSRFHGIMNGQAAHPERPFEVGLSQLLTELSTFTQPAEQQAFVQAMSAYFGAMMWEANNRSCGWVPDEFSYQMLRPAAGAVPPFWELIGPINNVRLAPGDGATVYSSQTAHPSEHSEALKRLATLAGRLVCWHNDVLSHDKERQAGDVHNLCIVFERSRNLSTTRAWNEAVRFANDEVDEFAQIAARLREQAITAAQELYITTLESMIATTVAWTLSSQRYTQARAGAADAVLIA